MSRKRTRLRKKLAAGKQTSPRLSRRIDPIRAPRCRRTTPKRTIRAAIRTTSESRRSADLENADRAPQPLERLGGKKSFARAKENCPLAVESRDLIACSLSFCRRRSGPYETIRNSWRAHHSRRQLVHRLSDHCPARQHHERDDDVHFAHLFEVASVRRWTQI